MVSWGKAIMMAALACLIAGFLDGGIGYVQPVGAANQPRRELYAKDKQFMVNHHINGMILASNNITKTRPVVISNVDLGKGGRHRNQQLVLANRFFPIASLYKLYTGVAVQHLINQGKIKGSDPVNKYLPQVPHASQMTVDQLMAHRSGMVDIPPKNNWPRLTTQHQQMNCMIKHLHWTGQHRWQYANANFEMLSFIVSKVNRQSFTTYMYQHELNQLPLRRQYVFANKSLPFDLLIVTAQSATTRRQLLGALSEQPGATAMLTTPMAYWQFIKTFVTSGPVNQFAAAGARFKPYYYGGAYFDLPQIHAFGDEMGCSAGFVYNQQTKQTVMIFANNLRATVARRNIYRAWNLDFQYRRS